MALEISTDYPGKVFFYAADPQALLDAGYDSFRVEKKTSFTDAWVPVVGAIFLESDRWNYHFIDPQAKVGYFYRAVLQNSVTPGTPADIPQPQQRAVDVSYEAIMTVQEFRDIYLWGEDSAFITDNGAQQPEYTFAHNIRYGIGKVEKKLNLKLLPTRIVETHDFEREAYARGEWLNLPLDEFPVISVESLKLKLPGQSDYDFPTSWIRVDKDTGALYVVPDGVAGSGVMPSMPRQRFVPQGIEVTYFAGMQPGMYQTNEGAVLKEVVGKEGSFGPLNVGGDLVGGAGLAGTSLSLDGLSQSITTTNSSTNAGFGARLLQYEKELKETYKSLIPYYRGIRMRVA